MGGFSRELCGGTHLENTSQVGPFEITAEESVSAGIRRVTALTGEKARQYMRQTTDALQQTAEQLSVAAQNVPAAVADLMQRVRDLKKSIASGSKAREPEASTTGQNLAATSADFSDIKSALRDAARRLNVAPLETPHRVATLLAEVQSLTRQLADMGQSSSPSAESLLDSAETVDGVTVIVSQVENANPNTLRQLIDQIRKETENCAVMLATSPATDKVVLVAGLTRNLVSDGLSAGDWVRDVAPVVGGGGGGKPDMAQAGGKQPEKLTEALEVARAKIRDGITAKS